MIGNSRPLLLGTLILVGVVAFLFTARADSPAQVVLRPAPAPVTPVSLGATVEIDAAPGRRFSGAIGSAGSQRSVEGRTPTRLSIAGAGSLGIYTAVIQKAVEGRWQLTVHLRCGGHVVSQNTTAEFGVVTVSCSE